MLYHRECQVKDWKSGIPRPHKLTCGRPLTEEEDGEGLGTSGEQSAIPDQAGIPDPDPGYKRSPALLHTISLLRENPSLDYIVCVSLQSCKSSPNLTITLQFVHPYPDPDIGVTFAHVMGKGPLSLSKS